MVFGRLQHFLVVLSVAATVFAVGMRASHADVVAEWFFWDSIGNSVSKGASSFAEYQAERQSWLDHIKAAKAQLARCGDCEAARAELHKWQGVEDQFQTVAGGLAKYVDMPPIVASWLGIDMPMTSGDPEATKSQKCTIERRPWVDDLPQYCQAAVDAYLGCLRDYKTAHSGFCLSDYAQVPGGQCWEESKLFNLCAGRDFEGYKQEMAIRARRKAGEIIPEFGKDGRTDIVDYKNVPDDFAPKLPPPNVAEKAFYRDGVDSIVFLMQKTGGDALTGVVLTPLDRNMVMANWTQCTQHEADLDRKQQRICDMIVHMGLLGERQDTLVCRYGGEGYQMPEPYVFWYGPPPPGADPEFLLRQADWHPYLRVGPQRSNCPATRQEAQAILDKDWAQKRELAQHVDRIPYGQPVPRPQWYLDILKKQEEREREQAALAKRREEALSGFDLPGVYDLTLEGSGFVRNGTCSVGSNGDTVCKYEDGNFDSPQFSQTTAYGLPVLSMQFGRSGERTVNFYSAIDVERRDKTGEYRFISEPDKATSGVSATLLKTGDMPELTDVPAGTYSLYFKNRMHSAMASGTCQISFATVNDKSYGPYKYDLKCQSEGGIKFIGRGRIRDGIFAVDFDTSSHDEELHTALYTNTNFFLDPNSRSGAPDIRLIHGNGANGYIGPGIGGELIRIGSLPTHALKEEEPH